MVDMQGFESQSTIEYTDPSGQGHVETLTSITHSYNVKQGSNIRISIQLNSYYSDIIYLLHVQGSGRIHPGHERQHEHDRRLFRLRERQRRKQCHHSGRDVRFPGRIPIKPFRLTNSQLRRAPARRSFFRPQQAGTKLQNPTRSAKKNDKKKFFPSIRPT